MKAFTQILPRLLEKLEVIRQVLETHGLEAKEVSCDADSINWELQRGTYRMDIRAYLRGAGRVVLAVSRFDEKHSSTPHLWVYYEEGEWGLVRNHGDLRMSPKEFHEDGYDGEDLEYEWAWVQPLAALFESLPSCGLDDVGYSEPVAREALGMIAAFFAKLPVDVPAATTTP